ncbi:hypothetical protein HOY82DRAFT_641040 [Tuber indicum]|nr:hypothetical protein HOY82DRAFT_641040 [Tuber indicum]
MSYSFSMSGRLAPLNSPPTIFKVPAMTSQKRKQRKRFQHWQESDHEIIIVSLANRGLLRNLWDTEAEDLITGKGYSAQLRRQFDRIYPVPEWAVGSSDRKKEALRSAPRIEEILSSTTSWIRMAPRRLQPWKLTIVWLADGNLIGGSLVGRPFPFYRPINKFPISIINPALLSPPGTSVLGPQLNPQAAPHKWHHNPSAIFLNPRKTPISIAHFHPVSTRTIAAGLRGDAGVNGNILHLARQMIHRAYRQPLIHEQFERNDIPVGLHRKFRSPGCRHILVVDSHDQAIGNTGGGVWEIDMLSETVVARWNDGGVHKITVPKNGWARWVAIRSESGIINENPKTVKALEQLTIAISVNEFPTEL